jgi:trimeric autotransporter adhesin
MKTHQSYLYLILLSLTVGLGACENSKIMGSLLTPSISTMTPNSVAAGTAQFSLQIDGSNFTLDTVVLINGSRRPADRISVNGVLQPHISGTVFPSDVAMPGTAQITVVNPGGRTSNVVTLTITPGPNPVPSIASVSPASAPAGTNGQPITVHGTNFVPLSQIYFGDQLLPFTLTKFDSDMQLEGTIPDAFLMNSGQVSIAVKTPAPGGGTSNAVLFTVR